MVASAAVAVDLSAEPAPPQATAPETAAPESPGPIEHRRAPLSRDYAPMMRDVTEATGKTYFAQVKDILALATGPGALSPGEYFLYRLYDDAIPAARKAQFVGHKLRTKIVTGHFDPAIFEVGLDKLAFYARALELGLPTPRVAAVFHAERSLAGAHDLRTEADLGGFLRQAAAYPLFGKPNKLSASIGTVSLSAYHADADAVELGDGRRFPVSRMVAEIARYFPGGYMFQERLAPHAEVRAIAGSTLSTVRVMALDLGQGPQIFRASWRVPMSGKVADVSWRGNVMAAIDPATGRAERAGRGRGLQRVEIQDHPETGRPIVGTTLPDWADACALVTRAATAFAELPLTGWDVALTDRGPILIELEPDGGDPSVTQLASGVGLLDGPYATFVKQVTKRGKVKAGKQG